MSYLRLPLIVFTFSWVMSLYMLSMISCETRVYPELPKGDPVLVVDAWLNNKQDEIQEVILSWTKPYFDTSKKSSIRGAKVSLSGDGKTYFFDDENGVGIYSWNSKKMLLDKEGVTYVLNVEVDGNVYQALSMLGRVPKIDSLVFRKNSLIFSSNATNEYIGSFWATDPLGTGDAYWIKKSVESSKPNSEVYSTILLAYDAGFSKGGKVDGVSFIQPIRDAFFGLQPNDRVTVELHSVGEKTFDFLQELSTQANYRGGFSAFFSTPLSNIPTNIRNVDPKGKPAIGYFNIANVSSLTNVCCK